MTGWTCHKGVAVALPIENVDTDQLIPARFMSAPRSQGYGSYLLYDMSHDEAGELVPEFPLNRHPGASVLVSRRNFGCGSSREAAVYALVDHGIRTVIAPSFGDIFAANAINNGLLPARVEADAVEAVIAALGTSQAEAVVNLETGSTRIGDHELSFHLEEEQRNKLANGWDDIDLTQSHEDVIGAFKQDYARRVPWARPAGAQNFAT
ncbi:3-isopropylmalate dehydratase small subunit [Roseibium sp.]|uniref:3-isopropylmalate dehydratase small subunit n=1 Tax=Roseibium sp. TaxID=1936156 RepID=UPI003A97371F